MTDEKNPFIVNTEGESKPPSNPAEQNPKVGKPETSGPQSLVDAFSVGMKPARSDSSSETFVADSTEALRHDQAQRIQEGNVMSSDAPNDQDRSGKISGDKNVLMGGTGDPNLRSATNPGGLTDLSPDGIRESTKVSQVRPLGTNPDDVGGDEKFAAYVGGRQIVMKKDKFEEYKSLLQKSQDALDDRSLVDVPLDDDYYKAEKELDKFLARL